MTLIFKRQVLPALSWSKRFHEHNPDDVVKNFSLVDRQLDGMAQAPQGGGAACLCGTRRLSQQDPPKAFVATLWTEEDEQLLGVEREVPAHQATWEAFVALLAVCDFVIPRTRGRRVLVGDVLGVWFGMIRMTATKIHQSQ